MSSRSKPSRDRNRRDERDDRRSRHDRDERDERRDDRKDERREDRDRKDKKDNSESKRKRSEDDIGNKPRENEKDLRDLSKDANEEPVKKPKISEEEEKLLLAIAEKKKQTERLARVQAWKQIAGDEPITTDTDIGVSHSASYLPSTPTGPIVTKSALPAVKSNKLKTVSLFASSIETDDSEKKKILTKLDDSLQNAQEGDRLMLLKQAGNEPAHGVVENDVYGMDVDDSTRHAPEEEEEDELDDEDEIERERTTRHLKQEQQLEQGEESHHIMSPLNIEPGVESMAVESNGSVLPDAPVKKDEVFAFNMPITTANINQSSAASTRNKVSAWKGKQPNSARNNKKGLSTEAVLFQNEGGSDVDPLAIYMRAISHDFKTETESAMAKAKEEAAKRGDVQIEDEEVDHDAVIVKKKLIEAIDHRKQVYNDFRKEFYIPCPEIAKMTPLEISTFRKELDGIKIRGKRCPNPVKSFAQCGLKPKILSLLERFEYTKPTPIQAQAIPAVMSGLDVIGIAKTGSGKTLAYLLPMFRHIMDQPPLDPADGPIAIIMVPTRELAVQIHTECGKFSKVTNIRSACVYGGAGVKHQIGDLKRGAEIVVCTPGRMIDVLCANKGRVTNLKRVTFLVLDEADRMFDMGFEPQITRIIQNIRPTRQTVLFSATFPRSVEIAARKILIKPVEISIRGTGVVSDTITQLVRVIVEEDKMKVLLEYIADWYEKGNILVFVDTQESTDQLWREVLKSGYTSCGSLHGGKEQLDRDFTLKEFKAGNLKILVATSVAARGLDVPLIRLVVNFDCPNHLEDYVHRCGRTGRAGVPGTAVTFLAPAQEQYSRDLVKAITASGQDVPPELAKIYNDFESKRKAGVAKKHKSQFLNVRGFKFDDHESKAKTDLLKVQKMAHGVVQDYDINIDSDDDVDDSDEEVDDTVTTESLQQELMTQRAAGGDDAGERAKQFANEIVSKQVSKLHSAMRYSEDLEVNDYPQSARWKVLQQSGMNTITEMTGCGLTTKGVFVAPGRQPPPGQRKLFLFIEGNTIDEVRKAKFEIKRMLDEAVQTGRPDAQTYGKYTV